MFEPAIAVEISPRPKPSSYATGLRKTPAANTLIAPCPAIKAKADASTIHQRFRVLLMAISPCFPFP